LHFVRLKDAR